MRWWRRSGCPFAPAYDGAALNPGCMPLFVALIAALVLGEKLSDKRGTIAEPEPQAGFGGLNPTRIAAVQKAGERRFNFRLQNWVRSLRRHRSAKRPTKS